MEKFPMEQIEAGQENIKENIFNRVTEHSREFDKETAKSQLATKEEIREAWQVEKWKIGDTIIQAIGVHHTPETFLEFRKEIEEAIQNSDVIVNEFAPEALGFYDKTHSSRLQSIKSKFNEDYNLEQLKQTYLKFERSWGIGSFHHEIELLTAKYGKNMVCADLTLTKNVESSLQDSYLYQEATEEVKERNATLKRLGLYGTAAALGIAGLSGFLSELQLKRPITRRVFLKKMGLLAASASLAGITPKITKVSHTPQEKIPEINESKGSLLQNLRNIYLANSLGILAKLGYKNIAFIYGRRHLEPVKFWLYNPEMTTRELLKHKEVIEHNNPDAFRIYCLSSGENNSEKFVASPKMIWKRII